MTPQEQWTAVDRYLTDLLVPSDTVLDAALAASEAAGLPSIHVAPNQGKLLMLLARLHRAQRILELGTLGGYSTLWLARALPATGGKIITLEADPKHAEVARDNFKRAGLESRIELRAGLAVDRLRELVAERAEPFDFIFIDADKPSYPEYLTWSLKLSRPGTVIVADNIVRAGAVIDLDSSDPRVHGVRHFNDLVAAEPRLNATAIQTVGSKGYDGFVIALVER